MFLTFIAFVLFFNNSPAFATELTEHNKILTQSYATSVQWTSLLHMSKSIFGSYKSRIEAGSAFFLAADGFKHPESELNRTLDQFQQPFDTNNPNSHALCKYPARRRILERDLKFAFAGSDCPELTKWKKTMSADEVVLVYSSQYVSNPASMMGHTFLKFLKKEKEDYLNQALGYAAEMDDDVSAMKYIYNGLFGGFNGVWPENLYYEKVHEYNNMESRDMWEYHLKLSETQKELLLEHLWELKRLADIRYFFIDENCSYMILATLQAVLPEYDFLSSFPIYVIPIETVKKLNEFNLISKEVYRPSIRNRMLRKFSALDSNEKETVLASVSEQISPETSSPLVYESILDYVELKRQRNSGRMSEQMANFEKEALVKRSRLGQHSSPQVTVPGSPLKGHGSYLLEVGTGRASNKNYVSFGGRIAVHGYLDKDQGYLKNSSFSFFDTELRYDTEMRLSRLTVFDIGSMNPSSSLDPVFSWRVLTGYQESQGVSEQQLATYDAQLQFGLSWEMHDRIDFSLLAMTVWQPIEFGGNDHRLWLGPHSELVWRPFDRIKLVQQLRYLGDLLGRSRLNALSSETIVRAYDVTNHLSIGVGIKWIHYYSKRPEYEDSGVHVYYDF